MTASKFVFVGQPHDPRSISGSDPYNAFNRTQDGAGNARLAAWYNCDVGNFVTGTLVDNNNGSLWMLRDISGNSKDPGFSSIQRNLYRTNDCRPILTGSGLNVYNDTNHIITGDSQNCMVGSNDLDGTYRGVQMINSTINGSSTQNSGDTNIQTWASGSMAADTNKTLEGGYSLFTTMRLRNVGPGAHHEADYTFPLSVTYPTSGNNGVDYGESGPFSMGLVHGPEDWYGIDGDKTLAPLEVAKRSMTGYAKDNDSIWRFGTERYDYYWPDTFHVLSMTYDNQNDTKEGDADQTERDNWSLNAYRNSLGITSITGSDGEKQSVQSFWATSDEDTGRQSPRTYRPNIMIGGTANQGGGRLDTSNMQDYYNAVHEFFVFDDALSDIRRQQMERYLCDRLDLEQSGASHLSQFTGGPKGKAYLHTRLSNALAGNGEYCRAYEQMLTSSGSPTIHYETAAGAFLRSSADSGAFYRTPSSKAIRLEAWVRCTGLTDNRHDGSHFALVAKASSPFGHKVDNIKGYALKFGTFLNGTKENNTLKLRLSLRHGDQWTDGTTIESCGDIEVSHGSVSLAADAWFKIRLTVTPSGLAYDQITCHASTDGTTWHALADGSSNTSWNVLREDANYRFWCNDPDYDARVRSQNGIHNGYWVAMKSTNGERVATKYFVDGFACMVDTI